MIIFQVTHVTVIKVSSSPLKLEIHASGLAATSGWTNPKLDPVATPPGDHILEFAFEATPPDGISLPVLTPIQAATEVEPPNPIAGVTVIARTNRITIHASQFSSGQFTTHIAGEENPTTEAIGEEHPTTLIAGEENPTTQAVGEEHPTTLPVGEEHPTTLAVGEEHPTTTLLGEEHVTTFIVGEEQPTTLWRGEESTTHPQLDDPAGGGFTTLAVGEEQGGGPFGQF
jgi:hypothetical protein